MKPDSNQTCLDASSHDGEPVSGYRILHIVDESLPLASGYATRTNGMTRAQAILGDQPCVLTGPTHQLRDVTAQDTVIDGVPYVRTPNPKGATRYVIERRWPIGRELAIITLFRRSILHVLSRIQFDIIHAHSPLLNGLAALQAARARKIPFVYEVRAFWEDAAVDQGKTTTRSVRYLVTRRLEHYLTKNADAVVGIANGILDELRTRGIEQSKLFHVPNAVDTEKFQPVSRNESLSTKLGIQGIPVLGFIGSLFSYEGIPWLIKAASELRRRGHLFKLLIIGHGEDAAAITKSISENNAHEFAVFLGTVPHDQIRNYYSVIDIMVYPRRRIRLTELVTPLKPLEAMALGRAVLGSSVGGICELVENEKTGLLFAPGDVDDFCRQASRLISDGHLRDRLAENGRKMILQRKTWADVAERYHDVYAMAEKVRHSRNV
jgi:PEP-CTERM/exosortase A-associated glycosyltransferase